jgi:hypothetical protein
MVFSARTCCAQPAFSQVDLSKDQQVACQRAAKPPCRGVIGEIRSTKQCSPENSDAGAVRAFDRRRKFSATIPAEYIAYP